MSEFAKGAKVRAKSPVDYIAEIRRKITDRVGTVVSFTCSGDPIVLFAKEGRRKEFRFSFRDNDLELAK